MMFSKSKSKNALQTSSMAYHLTVLLLSLIATCAALVGVVKAHVLSTGMTFGTLNCSMSLVAFAINLFFLTKLLQCWMPEKKK